jgi:predicted RNA-binding protein associated with RNAse of E/G family
MSAVQQVCSFLMTYQIESDELYPSQYEDALGRLYHDIIFWEEKNRSAITSHDFVALAEFVNLGLVFLTLDQETGQFAILEQFSRHALHRYYLDINMRNKLLRGNE